VDYKLIYGNFPLGSQSVDVSHGPQVLGTVPSVNLLRLHRGATVRFAGKRWRVCEANTEGIRVEPAHGRGRAVDFIYPGAGVGFGAFLTNRMWGLLHSASIPLDCLAAGLRQTLQGVVTGFRTACRPDQIPFHRTATGIRYFTFAGHLANKAIALVTSQSEFTAEDFYLDVITPIDWAKLPTKPAEYEDIFHSLVEATSAQSIYQTFLPAEFQRQEYLQEWLKSEEVEQVLTRLKSSTPVRLDAAPTGFLSTEPRQIAQPTPH